MSATPPPHAGRIPAGSATADDFVRAMAHHASSVCIITTSLRGQRFGLTATAVASVCTNPPRLLACINKSGATHEMIRQAGNFCVNVLAEDQDHLAKVFASMAGKATDRFAVGTWTELVTGAPCLADAACAIDCRIGEVFDQFTHSVLVGDVLATAVATGQDPLLYGLRRFRQLRKTYSPSASSDGEMLYL